VNYYQVTRFVTFRRGSTEASPCSSVWQNGDAGLAVFFQLIADGAGTTFVADGRLQAVDAARARIGGDNMLLEPLQLGSVSGSQNAPLSGGAGFVGVGAQLNAKAPLPCAGDRS
jgi:hypothetical protein